ncbi:cytochrome c [uncultured Cohaesibacter sp.]|uniref:c-type cytochrome n=1 Tax=uncultured Cohaesibacter sp. TaxID=1002546 RepID=UPI002AAB7B2E|nr:cytochrome c [uncultured Cohaesibacter sp.]
MAGKKRSKSQPVPKSIIVATVLAAVVAVGLGGMIYVRDSSSQGLLRPDNEAVVAMGKEIYAAQCAACHGENLQGQPNWRETNEDGRLPAPPHDETGHTWHHADELLFGITKYGLAEIGNMPGYQTDMPIYKDVLSDEEIMAVLSYIKSTWPAKIRRMHDQRNAMN